VVSDPAKHLIIANNTGQEGRMKLKKIKVNPLWALLPVYLYLVSTYLHGSAKLILDLIGVGIGGALFCLLISNAVEPEIKGK